MAPSVSRRRARPPLADAGVIAEVEQGVDHRGDDLGAAAAVERTAGEPAARDLLELVHLGALVAELTFEADRAQVITRDVIDVEAVLMIDRHGVVERADVEIEILDDHRAAFDTDIERAIARQYRSCQSRG